MIVKQKGYMIFIYIVLMISAIAIVDISYLEDQEAAKIEGEPVDYEPSLPVESGVFEQAALALAYKNMPDAENPRTLEEYYANRAYTGAPPTIPHELLSVGSIGGKSCLQCHQSGGYVERFEAYAPVTPHPEYLNCKQCHVPSAAMEGVFRASNWERNAGNDIHQSALEGSPPVIPHSLQLRDNCLACHGGPSAPKEIRVTHPERVNCLQCHAQKNSETIEWTRNE